MLALPLKHTPVLFKSVWTTATPPQMLVVLSRLTPPLSILTPLPCKHHHPATLTNSQLISPSFIVYSPHVARVITLKWKLDHVLYLLETLKDLTTCLKIKSRLPPDTWRPLQYCFPDTISPSPSLPLLQCLHVEPWFCSSKLLSLCSSQLICTRWVFVLKHCPRATSPRGFPWPPVWRHTIPSTAVKLPGFFSFIGLI